MMGKRVGNLGQVLFCHIINFVAQTVSPDPSSSSLFIKAFLITMEQSEFIRKFLVDRGMTNFVP